MNTFNQLKLGIVTLASIGMIAACGGGSSSGSSSAAGAKAAAPSTCPTKIQFALREFLTDESAAKLASGASMQDIEATGDLAWVLVSEEGDFWYDTIYLNEDGTLSNTDANGGTQLTLVMYGTGHPTQTAIDSNYDRGIQDSESYSENRSYIDFVTTTYDIFEDMNFAYVDLNKGVDENSHSVLFLLRSTLYANAVLDETLVGSERVLFPNLLDLTADNALSNNYQVMSISDENKQKLILDLAKAVIASESYDVTNFRTYEQNQSQETGTVDYSYEEKDGRYTEVETYYNSDMNVVFEDTYSDVLSYDYIDATYTSREYGDDESLLQVFSYEMYDDNTPDNYEYSSESLYYWGDRGANDNQLARQVIHKHPNGKAHSTDGSDLYESFTYNQEGTLIRHVVDTEGYRKKFMYDEDENITIMSQHQFDLETHEMITTTYYSPDSDGNLQELTDQDIIELLVAQNEQLYDSLGDAWYGMMSDIHASRVDEVFNYKEGLAGYLNQFSQLNAGAIMMYDAFKSGTLPLNKTDLSQACLVKVMKDVPLDGDDNEGIAPVEIINLSNNKTVTVEALKAMLEELETNGKGESIISIDVRNTSITADQAKDLMDTESMLSIYEVLGITLIHDGMEN